MAAQDALPIICPKCRVGLVRISRTGTDEILFCPRCGAGGSYTDVLADRGNLTDGFVTEAQIDEFLRQLRIPPP